MLKSVHVLVLWRENELSKVVNMSNTEGGHLWALLVAGSALSAFLSSYQIL